MSSTHLSSLIELTPDTDLQDRLILLAKSAGISAADQRKLAEAVPANQPGTLGSHLISAQTADELQNGYELLAHAIGSGRRILVTPDTYQSIYP